MSKINKYIEINDRFYMFFVNFNTISRVQSTKFVLEEINLRLNLTANDSLPSTVYIKKRATPLGEIKTQIKRSHIEWDWEASLWSFIFGESTRLTAFWISDS